MSVIDFHNHYYPPEYLQALEQGPSNYKITFDDQQNPVLHSPGDYNIVVPGHRDIEFRQRVLQEAGIDCQVLSFTAPGTLLELPDRSAELAEMVNNAFGEIVRERGGHFTALATLPLNNPAAAVGELHRALTELNLPGAMLYSNVNGAALSDEPFWPIYECADQAEAVLYIHPTYPVGVETMQEYWLMPLLGFTFDTTLAAAKLVFSGVVQRFPRIRWALCHLGGTIPYLAERLDRGFEAFSECRRNITRPPSEYLRQFYYDTVNFDPRALQLAIDFAGVEHILAGSDYPHQIGSLSKMLSSIDQLHLTGEQKQKILSGNARQLLDLRPR